MKNKIPIFILLSICAATIFLALPTINDNINDPNMIVYFNADEGGFMDLLWSYYSGEKRESYQFDLDYGLEMPYLADLARLCHNFLVFTPGTFVLILRWLHLAAWILSFFALWRLVKRHFGGEWMALLVVAILAVRPAFSYFLLNLKPEPLVLLLMIIGLDYTLRILEKPFKRFNFFTACACGAIAFLIKYAGVFLLPAVVCAMFFANRYHPGVATEKSVFPNIKFSWLFPAFAGIAGIAMPLVALLFYVRKSTGLTWYDEFGLSASLAQNKPAQYMCLAGILLIIVSAVILFLKKLDIPSVKKKITRVDEFNSHMMIASGTFLFFIVLFGFKWIMDPALFLNTYSQISASSITNTSQAMFSAGTILPFLRNLIARVNNIDPIIFALFALYIALEFLKRKRDEAKCMKRRILLTFLLPGFIVIFTIFRMRQHNLLPFFTAISILGIQGVYMLLSSLKGKRLYGLVLPVLCAFLVADILLNAALTVKLRMREFLREEDTAYEIKRWFNKNVSKETKIVADHYIVSYIPEGYKNIKTLPHWQNRALQFRELVNTHKPRFIYYNEGPDDISPMPPIKSVLPERKVRLVRTFDGKMRKYERKKGDKFFIYELEN
ncbi:MAG: glycosyltransferase family 39 protein [Omnitrophica bacterium]|nr:glycosyltransferase family 39 protein [Candidatus Omnitrophota bacterium]